MMYGFCEHCGRRFKTDAQRQLAERYAAVVADLKGIAPAKHLDPAVMAAEAAAVQEPYHTYNRDHAED